MHVKLSPPTSERIEREREREGGRGEGERERERERREENIPKCMVKGHSIQSYTDKAKIASPYYTISYITHQQ